LILVLNCGWYRSTITIFFLLTKLYQVLRVVKTRQVTYSVLKHLSDYVQNLQKTGLLEEKEMFHLDDALQVPQIYPFLNKLYLKHPYKIFFITLFCFICFAVDETLSRQT
jgi:hypothetical protein